jgi:hypothetical protein
LGIPLADAGATDEEVGMAAMGVAGVALGTRSDWTDPPRKLAGEQLANTRQINVKTKTFFIV